MAFKFVIICCLVAVARSATIPVPALVETVAVAGPPTVVQARTEDFDPSPQYAFEYNVVDTVTGDVKSQSETRNGDIVQGRYTLVEPDGSSLRVVDYLADIDGFKALVHNEPLVSEGTVLAEPAVVGEAVVPTRIATPATFPAARVVSGPTAVAPAPVFAQARFPATFPAAPAQLARYAYQPFSRFAAPFAYPGATAQIIAV